MKALVMENPTQLFSGCLHLQALCELSVMLNVQSGLHFVYLIIQFL